MDLFNVSELVPDVLDHTPNDLLQVRFGDHELTTNEVLTPTQVKDEPCVKWSADENAFYTIIMGVASLRLAVWVCVKRDVSFSEHMHHALYRHVVVNHNEDPDSPTRANPIRREFNHWLVVNVPGCNVKQGEHRTPFVSSGPTKGTGLHRYVLMVFKQPERCDFKKIPQLDLTKEGRPKRTARTILKEMEIPDAPCVAANFYSAEYDDHVPFVHKMLGIVPPPAQ